MEESSLKILEADKTFFTKITTTISKILIPTKVGINGLMISMKRNNLLKAYEAYTQSEDSDKKEQRINKYEESYSLYLESIDKYIMDSVYKKVKSGSASSFEAEALSRYYTIVQLKDNAYVEYKHRKQKYLLELDYETVESLGKEKLYQRYKEFYITKIDSLYKGILKNYSVGLADANAAKFGTNIAIYDKIFDTLQEYSLKVLPLKLEDDKDKKYDCIKEDYEKVERFEVGKLDELDKLERKMLLLGISRSIFTHSLPLVSAGQCYIQLLKEARSLVMSAKNDKKKQEAYKLLLEIMKQYNEKLLSNKVYWDKPEERNEYKAFCEKYKKAKSEDEKQVEILFIKEDLKKIRTSKKNYKKMIDFYIQKLVEYGAIRNIPNKVKTLEGNWTRR